MKINNKIILIILLFAFIIRIIYLSSIPGLQFDEAWYGIRTYEIKEGIIFPYTGMNDYTSPIIEYLRVPFYWIFGVNVFSLRLPIVILNVLTILYSYLLLKKLYNEKTALISALLLAVFPWSIIYSRFADSVHTTLPFFAIAGLYYIIRDKKLSSKFLAGLFLGLGLYTHTIFISVITSYLFYFIIIKNKLKLKINKLNLVIIFSFILAILPKLYSVIFKPGQGGLDFFYNLFKFSFLQKIIAAPPTLLKMVDGTLFYQRTTGSIWLYVLPINSILFILAIIFLIFIAKHEQFKKNNYMLLTIFFVNWFITVSFVKYLSLRYHCVILTFSTIIVGIFLGSIKINKKILYSIVTLIVAINLFYLTTNYFISFKNTGGNLSYFWVGNFYESSSHFVDIGPLFDCALKEDIRMEYSDIFIDTPLRFYFISKGISGKITNSNEYYIKYKDKDIIDQIKERYILSKKCTDLRDFDIYLIEKK